MNDSHQITAPPLGATNIGASASNPLPTTDSLREWQTYVKQMNIDRGFDTEEVAHKLVLIMEEVGELAKAIRQHIGLKFSESTATREVREEVADVQLLLLSLANRLDVDVTAAMADKEAKNMRRNWKELS